LLSPTGRSLELSSRQVSGAQQQQDEQQGPAAECQWPVAVPSQQLQRSHTAAARPPPPPGRAAEWRCECEPFL
jgi:hypothetical protein